MRNCSPSPTPLSPEKRDTASIPLSLGPANVIDPGDITLDPAFPSAVAQASSLSPPREGEPPSHSSAAPRRGGGMGKREGWVAGSSV